MNSNLFTRLMLGVVILLLLMNFMQGIFSTGTVEAVNEGEGIGRYQISAWASQTPVGYHHGYYVVDTVTGKVIDSKAEIHSSKE